MKLHRALLLSGVCAGLLSGTVTAQLDFSRETSADRAPADRGLIVVAEDTAAPAEAAAEAAAPADPAAAPPAAANAGVTSYYGDTAPATAPAWAAEAAMNPDYVADPASAPTEAQSSEPLPAPVTASDEPAAPVPAYAAEATMNPDYSADATTAAPAAEPAAAEAAPAEAPAAEPAAAAEAPAEAAAEAPAAAPAATAAGVTSYYGETASVASSPFSAEATMNPDYTAEAPATPAAADAPAAEAPAAEAAAAPAATAAGVTSFFGDTTPTGTPAWAAEATMNTDAAPAAASASTQQAVEACRDALNAEAMTGSILFATSKWDVLPQSYRTLDKIAKIAKDCSASFVIEVGGHTDSVGKEASNRTLSELRAQAVVKYLTRAGIDAAKLKAVGYGADKPVADNDSTAGRRKNRRIEFLVTNG
ncbi:MAG: OmpA family protein [Hyphomicrobium sp.]